MSLICTATLKQVKSRVEQTLGSSTIFDKYPPNLIPNEPLKIVFTSSRHGIGGAASDLSHIGPIFDAAKQKFSGRDIEVHVFAGSRAAFDGFPRITFHADAFQPANTGAGTLDPLMPLKGREFVGKCAEIKPHYIVCLDSAQERSPEKWNTKELVAIPSVAAVVASSASMPCSGYYAATVLEILSKDFPSHT